MLKRTRTYLAIFCLLSITLLFLDFSGFIHPWLGWLAKIQFFPSLLALNVVVVIALVLLTAIFGRIYCSIICPLGILQDILARLRPIKDKKRGYYSYSSEKKWIRYSILIAFIIALIAGIGSVVALLEPYSSFGRIAMNLLQPVFEFGNNLLANIAEKHDSYSFYHVDIWMHSLHTFLIAFLTFIILAIMAWIGGRTYCNTICPVGTLLSFISRFSFLKICFDEEKCRNCSACSKVCKASCIDYKSHTVDYSRCIDCGNCIDACKFGALRYKPLSKSPRRGEYSSISGSLAGNSTINVASENSNLPHMKGCGEGQVVSRRTFLIGTALATTTAFAQQKTKMDGGLAEIEDKVAPERKTPLTPPGSFSARHFQQHCTGCQLCVTKCPNQVLRPSIGLLTFMQPTMSYERGFCRPECNRCSEVCPTGAIRPITTEEKTSIQIGHAVWVKKNCVVLTDDVTCGNCARHCPTGAIQMLPMNPEDQNSKQIPTINESKCIGCGACEYLCPARPFSAIYVEGHEQHQEI